MKYRVSLLPESRRKLLNGKKRIEKIRASALVVMLILLGLLIVVIASKMVADSKLASAAAQNNKKAAEVSELEQYRAKNAELKTKVALLDQIKEGEPYLYQFLVKFGNVDHPGVTIKTIDCADWRYTRKCTITGTCETRAEFLSYQKLIEKLDKVTGVTVQSFTSGVGTADGMAKFTIVIAVGGGKPAPVVSTAAAATTAAATTE